MEKLLEKRRTHPENVEKISLTTLSAKKAKGKILHKRKLRRVQLKVIAAVTGVNKANTADVDGGLQRSLPLSKRSIAYFPSSFGKYAARNSRSSESRISTEPNQVAVLEHHR